MRWVTKGGRGGKEWVANAVKRNFPRVAAGVFSLQSQKLRCGNHGSSLVGVCTLVVARIYRGDDIEIRAARSH